MFFLTAWASYVIFLSERGWTAMLTIAPAFSSFGFNERLALGIAIWAMLYGWLKK
jgi:hypothetical protein